MINRTRLTALALAAAFAGSAVAAVAATITLYQGATINARLNQTLSSGSANVGDTFTMSVVPPYPAGNPAFQGATLSGVVTKVQRAGQGRNPEIDMNIEYLRMPNGTVANIYGTVTGIQADKSTQGTAAKAVAGAIAGMLIGNAIGKTVFHASGGGAAGFIGGAMLGANNKTNFSIPAGANATVQLNQTVTIRHQSGQ